jgi:hypothetical protein
MTGKVVPIGSRGSVRTGVAADANMRPRLLPRLVSHTPGLSREAIVAGCSAQQKLILKHEAELTALVARVLVDGLPPLPGWVAAVLTSAGPGDVDLVQLTSRQQAREITRPWGSICAALAEPSPPDRLDVVVEAGDTIGLVSFDPEPALPVTRKQAESANLPPHLLFARGHAFASLAPEPANLDALREAFVAHRRMVEERAEEVLDPLQRLTIRTPLEDLAGVLLALGPDGHAVSAVTREQARKLVHGHPLLEGKLARGAIAGSLGDGRDILSVPVVVWALGHVSVQTRELVESR